MRGSALEKRTLKAFAGFWKQGLSSPGGTGGKHGRQWEGGGDANPAKVSGRAHLERSVERGGKLECGNAASYEDGEYTGGAEAMRRKGKGKCC